MLHEVCSRPQWANHNVNSEFGSETMPFSMEKYVPFEMPLVPGEGRIPGHGSSDDFLSRTESFQTSQMIRSYRPSHSMFQDGSGIFGSKHKHDQIA